MRTRSGSKVRSRFLAVPDGPFRANSVGGELPRVNPGLCFLGHFGPWIGNVQTPSGPMRLKTYQTLAWVRFPSDERPVGQKIVERRRTLRSKIGLRGRIRVLRQ